MRNSETTCALWKMSNIKINPIRNSETTSALQASFEAELDSLELSKSVAAFVLKKIKEKATEKHDRNVFWNKS